VAENLGEARLQLTVDLDAFRRGLRDARALVESELRGAGVGGGRRGVDASERRREQDQRRRQRELLREQRDNQREIDRRARQGGPTENTRALEIAQEKRFRIARRIDALEERGADVSRLRNRLGQLTEAQSARQFGTFRQISRELSRQVVLVERRQQAAERLARAERQLASIGAKQGGARESVFARERAQDRRFGLSQRINRLEERGVNVSQLRTRLGELTTSQANRQFGTFRQISRELERQISLTEARARREREVQRVLDRRARTGGPSSPIGGSVLIPGSPAFNRAQERAAQQDLVRGARLGGARSPIGGSVLIPGSPAFLQEQQKLLRSQEQAQLAEIRKSARSGGARSPIAGSVLIPGSPAFVREQQRAAARQITQSARIGGPSLPISGRLSDGSVISGSPASRLAVQRQYEKSLIELTKTQRQEASAALRRRQALRGRASEALGSGLIGGAFPALFGQGAGASAGGLIGGALGGLLGAGGGFAGGLVGTLAGQQVDNLGNLAKALETPIAKFQELRDAGAISSKALETTIQNLIGAGRYSEAEALIRQDLAQKGLNAATANALSQQSDQLKRSLADLGVSFALVAQGPLTKFINLLNQALQPGSVAQRVNATLADLSPADQQGFKARREQLKRQGGQNIIDINLQVLDEYSSKTRSAQKITNDLVTARKKDNEALSIGYRLISAQVQGYERAALELEKQNIAQEASNKARQSPDQAAAINKQAALDIYRINEQLKQLDEQRWAANIAAANRLKDIQEQTAIQQARPNLTGVGVGALQSLAQFRAAQRREQDAQAAIRAQPGNQDLLNAAQEAAKNVKQAAATTKSDLQEAFLSAQEAVRNISRSLEDGRLAYAEMVNTSGQGVNKYLGAQQVRQNQEQLNPILLQQAQEAVRGYQQRTGQAVPSLSVTGTLEQRNAQLIDIARVFGQQERAVQDLALQSQELVKANNSLLTVNAALAATNTKVADALELNRAALVSLAGKDWNVYVTTPAQPMIPVPIGP